MFTAKEIKILNKSYFYVLRKNENYYEIQSKSTSHCWILQKIDNSDKYSIIIHHKHSLEDRYYHKHGKAFTVALAIMSVKAHDDFILQKI